MFLIDLMILIIIRIIGLHAEDDPVFVWEEKH